VRTAEPEPIQAVVGSSRPLLGRGGGCYTKTLLLTIRLPMPTRIKSHRFASLTKGQRPSHSFGTHTCAHWLPGGWQAGTLWWWHLHVCRALVMSLKGPQMFKPPPPPPFNPHTQHQFRFAMNVTAVAWRLQGLHQLQEAALAFLHRQDCITKGIKLVSMIHTLCRQTLCRQDCHDC
jgi:hypothetical protein